MHYHWSLWSVHCYCLIVSVVVVGVWSLVVVGVYVGGSVVVIHEYTSVVVGNVVCGLKLHVVELKLTILQHVVS